MIRNSIIFLAKSWKIQLSAIDNVTLINLDEEKFYILIFGSYYLWIIIYSKNIAYILFIIVSIYEERGENKSVSKIYHDSCVRK